MQVSQTGRKKKRKPMSEINVVPYIDVMLVLLIIFMITAPLMTQGVKVELPKASAKPMPTDEQNEPLIVTVDKEGKYYLSTGSEEQKKQAVNSDTLFNRVQGVLQVSPKTPVYIRGDADANYGEVVAAMTVLSNAGAPNVGLITEPPQKPDPAAK